MKKRKTQIQRQKEVCKTMLSEMFNSYIVLGITPDAQIFVLERSETLPDAIALNSLLEGLNRLKNGDVYEPDGNDLLGEE